jgi:tRNA A37 threonylcarbamoyladenosine synthetase subunit TsaC/SUA5/YrdC
VRVGDLPPQMLEQLDLVLDAGALPGGSGSTVVDLTGDAPLILREGVVSAAEIRSVWQARPT